MGDVITEQEARQFLVTEQQHRMKQYNDGIVKLGEETSCSLVVKLRLPGGDVVNAASYFKSLGIEAQPVIDIIVVNE